jgi:hypothetical protein
MRRLPAFEHTGVTQLAPLGDLRRVQTLPTQIRTALTISARGVVGRQMLQLLCRAKARRRDGPPARGWEPLINPSSTTGWESTELDITILLNLALPEGLATSRWPQLTLTRRVLRR